MIHGRFEVPPGCFARAHTGITLGTADAERKVHGVAPREAKAAADALDKLAARIPADTLSPPPS